MLGVPYQEFRDKVFDIIGKIFGELKINIHNLPIRLLPALTGLERRMPSAKLIAQHSNAPDIDHLIILRPKNNLRRDIIKRTTECFSLITTQYNKKCTFRQCR